MKAWKIITAGIMFAIIAQLIHTIESFATMSFYTDSKYFTIWSTTMMPAQGPPPTEFYVYSIMFGIIAGIIYAFVYEMIKKSLPVGTILKQRFFSGTTFKHGLYFGFLLFLLGIPMSLTMYLLINLPTMLLVYWSLSGLIVDLTGGVVIARIMK
jgi:hypothetical protein